MVEIVTNTLPSEAQDKVADSVKAAIGFRPGLWQVTLLGSRHAPRFVVFIRHPEAGFNRSWVFEKPEDPIQRIVESGLTLAGWEANGMECPA
jgi:hypothetical protein